MFGKKMQPDNSAAGNGRMGNKGAPEREGGEGLFRRPPRDITLEAEVIDVTPTRQPPVEAPPAPEAPRAAEAPRSEAAEAIGLRIKKKAAPATDVPPEVPPEVQSQAKKRASLVERFGGAKKAGDAADKPAKDSSPWWKLGGRKKPSVEPVEPAIGALRTDGETPTAEELKSAASPEAPAKPVRENAKKAAQARSAKKARAGKKLNTLDVLVELDNDKRVFWRVTANGMQAVAEEEVRQVASFSAKDYRYFAESALSYNQAHDLALSEIGEDCQIVNASKELEAVYASTTERVRTVSYGVGPGLLLLENILLEQRYGQRELIVGFLLADDESGQSLAILYYRNDRGVFSPPQVTVNPGNLSFTISQFASSKRLDFESAEVVLFKNPDLLSQASALSLYPAEPVWYGLAVRKIAWGCVSVLGLAAAGATLYAGAAYWERSQLEAEQARLTAETRALDQKLQTSISASIVSFAKTQGVPVVEASERAASLWVPFSRVTLEATNAQQKFDVLMPLAGRSLTNNSPSLLNRLGNNDVQAALGLAVPEGCVKDIPGVSGGVDAIQITITCEAAVGPLNRYRID